ncbi:MAG: hypothetical protein Q4E43_01135 [Akkermansia sp.]|nr:hypothetical protein [Akkermansia sp.]
MNKLITLVLMLVAALLLQLPASAQVEVQLTPNRTDYVAGEGVGLSLTVTNHTDTTLDLKDVAGHSWLNIILTQRGMGGPVIPKDNSGFPPMSIGPGSQRTITVNLRDKYALDTPGAFRAIATILLPDGHTTYTSNRALFNITTGGTIRSFPIQSRGRRLEISARLVRTAKQEGIFGQVVDMDTKRAVGACYMGRYINFMQPRVLLDGAQNLHVLCQSTPEFFTYSVMNNRGQRLSYQVYRRVPGVPVDLMNTGKGFRPVGLTPYDPKAEAKKQREKLHSTSERPL